MKKRRVSNEVIYDLEAEETSNYCELFLNIFSTDKKCALLYIKRKMSPLTMKQYIFKNKEKKLKDFHWLIDFNGMSIRQELFDA